MPAFELARHELTWAEWQLCEDAGGCTEIERPSFLNNIDVTEQSLHPVVNVNSDRVNEYLTWISEKTGQTYRLPSEAEWEYVARAGTVTTYYWGDAIGENQANCDGCGSQWDGQSTAPVGSFDDNPFGLNDVLGNVKERVADCWHSNYNGAPSDGSPWVDNCLNEDTVLSRGGSWSHAPTYLEASNRFAIDATTVEKYTGLRLARSLPERVNETVF